MGLTQKLGTIPLAIFTDASNNIGIGGSPSGSYKFEVTGISRFWDGTQGLLVRAYTGGSGFGAIYSTGVTPAAGNFALAASSTATILSGVDNVSMAINSAIKLYINSSGNVGIGTSSPIGLGGSITTLEIKGGSGVPTARTGGILLSSYDGTFQAQLYSESSLFHIGTGTNNTMLFETNNTERMRITSGGDVGIGTSSPFNKMTIRTGTNNNLDIFDTGSSFGIGMQVVNDVNTVYKSWDFYASKFQFLNGDLAIGTSSSGATFRVKCSVSDYTKDALYIENSSGSILFELRGDGLITTGGAYSPYNFNPGGRVMYVNSSGQVGSNSSTRESKININSILDIDYIYNLNPVSFYFRKTDMENKCYTDEYYEEIRYGFIADEVEPLNPDLVCYDTLEDGTKKMAGVEYISMIPVLVKALQEQKLIIDELSAKVSALENKS